MSKIQYESKSQHNMERDFKVLVFINMSKIQYESKSQPTASPPIIVWCFYQYVKDTI